MSKVEDAVARLDDVTATRVRPAVTWLRRHGDPADPEPALVRRYLTQGLTAQPGADVREHHEVAWALGDLFEQAGRGDLAALCRSPATHESMAVGAWVASFPAVPAQFWQAALSAVERTASVPRRAALSLASARALLTVVGDGLTLEGGRLPLSTVTALDDRFRWTEEFPWMRVAGEDDIAPLRILRDHLLAQGLLRLDGDRLSRSELGRSAADDTVRLWRAVVEPVPRWAHAFEQDALGVMAASVLRSAEFSLGRIGEEMTHVLAERWRPAARDEHGGLFDAAAALAQSWYRLGVPLGWWDTGRGPADRRPNGFGRAAAVTVLRAVTTRRRG